MPEPHSFTESRNQLKGQCVVFGEEIQTHNFSIYNINEYIL